MDREKIQAKFQAVLGWLRGFLRRHPLLSLFLLSLLAIFVAVLLERTAPSDQGVIPQEIEKQREQEVVEDFAEAQFPQTVNELQEQRAYNKYEKEVGVMEEESGEELEKHFDGSLKAQRESDRFIRSLNGMYNLPYRGKEILAKYVDVLDTPLGARYVISIGYYSTRQKAQREWQSYLRSQGDSGKYYILEYFRIH